MEASPTRLNRNPEGVLTPRSQGKFASVSLGRSNPESVERLVKARHHEKFYGTTAVIPFKDDSKTHGVIAELKARLHSPFTAQRYPHGTISSVVLDKKTQPEAEAGTQALLPVAVLRTVNLLSQNLVARITGAVVGDTLQHVVKVYTASEIERAVTPEFYRDWRAGNRSAGLELKSVSDPRFEKTFAIIYGNLNRPLTPRRIEMAREILAGDIGTEIPLKRVDIRSYAQTSLDPKQQFLRSRVEIMPDKVVRPLSPISLGRIISDEHSQVRSMSPGPSRRSPLREAFQ